MDFLLVAEVVDGVEHSPVEVLSQDDPLTPWPGSTTESTSSDRSDVDPRNVPKTLINQIVFNF